MAYEKSLASINIPFVLHSGLILIIFYQLNYLAHEKLFFKCIIKLICCMLYPTELFLFKSAV